MRTAYKCLQVHESNYSRDLPSFQRYFPFYYSKKTKETLISSLDFHFDRQYFDHVDYLEKVLKPFSRYQTDVIKISLKYFLRYYAWEQD